jgi:pimeloyl-ACP methyl ester carboxylesterase
MAALISTLSLALKRSGGAIDWPRSAGVLLAVAMVGCATAHAQLRTPGVPCPATVFVADGAGNFQLTSKTLRTVVQMDEDPLQVVTFNWSHGYGRVIADQVGYAHARAEGQRLADAVLLYRAQHPTVPLYLVGHSAGSSVVVAALETLPTGTVDRAMLLSPSLSSNYDLRPALASVGRGLYVYYSTQDYWYLGLVTGVLGTSDRRWANSSGRYGFQAPEGEDARLYGKLYQRQWEPSDAPLGNHGGHYGNYQPEFLRAHIIPLLQPGAPASP